MNQSKKNSDVESEVNNSEKMVLTNSENLSELLPNYAVFLAELKQSNELEVNLKRFDSLLVNTNKIFPQNENNSLKDETRLLNLVHRIYGQHNDKQLNHSYSDFNRAKNFYENCYCDFGIIKDTIRISGSELLHSITPDSTQAKDMFQYVCDKVHNLSDVIISYLAISKPGALRNETQIEKILYMQKMLVIGSYQKKLHSYYQTLTDLEFLGDDNFSQEIKKKTANLYLDKHKLMEKFESAKLEDLYYQL